MSNIIKGQRIRSETTLEIQNKKKYVAPGEGDKNLGVDKKSQKTIEHQMRRIQSQANTLLQDAKAEAEKQAALVEKQNQEKALEEKRLAIIEEAKAEGYSDGYKKGELAAQGLIEESKEIILEAEKEKQAILEQAEPEIIEMIIAICGKLISEEIDFNQDIILLLIRRALREISSDVPDMEITIKVSNHDYDYVMENKNVIIENVSNPDDIQILKDVNMDKGVCIIETSFGSVACNIDKAFAEMQKNMRLISKKK